ncbi:CvpA family protein [Bacillus xiapuensis]|uniref:CvpA family protein n=1 Tax=Bacillus xiapuensis TaxID=2014075 RepID=UPI000C241F64|nr:CvpA family protein [Bacillus xiapuensis]
MLTIILLLLLLAGIIIGLKRGFILQFFHMASSVIALIAAFALRKQVAPLLEQWIPMPPMESIQSFHMGAAGFESFYYSAIAFILLFIIVKIALSIIASFVNIIAHIPIIREVNKIFGGVLGFAEIYLVLFVLLYLAALLPQSSVQEWIGQSFVADYIIHRTPYLSDALRNIEPLSRMKNFSF